MGRDEQFVDGKKHRTIKEELPFHFACDSVGEGRGVYMYISLAQLGSELPSPEELAHTE